MDVQNTPLATSYNSYSLMAAAAAAAQSGGQGFGAHPVGSLEALRATWHAPRLPGQEVWQPGSLGAQPGQPGQQQQASQGLYGPGLSQSYLSSLQQQFQQEQNRYLPVRALPDAFEMSAGSRIVFRLLPLFDHVCHPDGMLQRLLKQKYVYLAVSALHTTCIRDAAVFLVQAEPNGLPQQRQGHWAGPGQPGLGQQRKQRGQARGPRHAWGAKDS